MHGVSPRAINRDMSQTGFFLTVLTIASHPAEQSQALLGPSAGSRWKPGGQLRNLPSPSKLVSSGWWLRGLADGYDG